MTKFVAILSKSNMPQKSDVKNFFMGLVCWLLLGLSTLLFSCSFFDVCQLKQSFCYVFVRRFAAIGRNLFIFAAFLGDSPTFARDAGW